MTNLQLVFVFDSIHHVLKAEKIIKQKGLSCELIPVPREITSDCGMALVIPEDAAEAARQSLYGNIPSLSIFQRSTRGYQKVP